MSKNVALVLSSGGAKGLAHIGAIEALEEHGFRITSVSGSSMGAVIGGLCAMDRLKDYSKWIKTLDKKDVWGLLDFAFTSNGLLKGERVFDKMKTFIPDMNIEDMNIPFSAVATDLLNEKEIVYKEGSYYDAIRASIAIPAVITPVRHGDTFLVDGGILSPIPIEYVKRMKDDILVVVNLYGTKGPSPESSKSLKKAHDGEPDKGLSNALSWLIDTKEKESMGYISLLTTSSRAMIHKMARMNIEKYNPDIVINVPYNSVDTFDFHRAKGMIEIGAEAARKEISKYLEKS